jgi:predicted esterase
MISTRSGRLIDRIVRARKKPLGCILALPGRGGSGKEMVEIYKHSELRKSTFIGVTPKMRQWYPMPNGANDQEAAISGLDEAVENIYKTLRRIRRGFGVLSRDTALVGFSAGAVVALQAAVRSDYPFAAVVCHSGAVLEPDKLPYCKHPETKILLIHSQDDTCFYWDERYMPMKQSLKTKGYNFISVEHKVGNHNLYRSDIVMSSMFLAPLLRYPATWKHSEIESRTLALRL